MKHVWALTATDQPDRNDERFDEEALYNIHVHAWDMPIRKNFEGPIIGKILAVARDVDNGQVEVLAEVAEGELKERLYIVPQFVYDPEDVTEEDGVKVHHVVRLMGFGLVTTPADPHLTPLKVRS